MADDQQYPWTRRETESTPAYEAFKVYLFQGADRGIEKAAVEAGRARSLFGRWSKQHGWNARACAYDSYMTTAAVDGMTDQITQVRNKHLDVASKLLDHLLDSMSRWKPDYDPSLRWTTAFTAAAKVQQTALTLRETTSKTDAEIIDRILDAVAKRAEG